MHAGVAVVGFRLRRSSLEDLFVSADRGGLRCQRLTSPASPGASEAGAGRASRPWVRARRVRPWFRLLRSELSLVFLRRRNIALLAVLAAVPVLLGIVLKVSSPQPAGGTGDGPAFLAQVTGNGVFLAFLALVVEMTLILPLAIAVVAGDSIASRPPAGGRCATCSPSRPGGRGCSGSSSRPWSRSACARACSWPRWRPPWARSCSRSGP